MKLNEYFKNVDIYLLFGFIISVVMMSIWFLSRDSEGWVQSLVIPYFLSFLVFSFFAKIPHNYKTKKIALFRVKFNKLFFALWISLIPALVISWQIYEIQIFGSYSFISIFLVWLFFAVVLAYHNKVNANYPLVL
ncbi:MAG: hypothetical protein IMY73_04690 [Bacteroidetes bacterium]|nr:hypothetical protein [Bacteroidota bacterium]